MAAARRNIAYRLAALMAFHQPVQQLACTERLSYPPPMHKLKVAAALAVLATAIPACQKQEPAAENAAVEPTGAPVKGVSRASAGQAAPDAELRDAEDEPTTLADVKGKPVLVNIWATWCAPCVKELPTLAALSKSPNAPRIIAVSQDMAPRGSVDAFLDDHKLTDIEVWQDPKMALSAAAGAEVLPTTILYDADGREVWRYVGDLDWTGEEAAKLLADARPAPKG